MGEAMSIGVAGEEWVEDRVGMNVYEAGQDWELGGPMVAALALVAAGALGQTLRD